MRVHQSSLFAQVAPKQAWSLQYCSEQRCSEEACRLLKLSLILVLINKLYGFCMVQAFEIMEQELGRPIAEVFSCISERPIAAASLGQVCRHMAAAPLSRSVVPCCCMHTSDPLTPRCCCQPLGALSEVGRSSSGTELFDGHVCVVGALRTVWPATQPATVGSYRDVHHSAMSSPCRLSCRCTRQPSERWARRWP